MQTKVVKIDSANIDDAAMKEACDLIRAGELVAFPTETVYGLGADALVLVMEHSQREKILEKYGHADPENVYVLTELVGDELEIIDPYGGTLQAYGLCYETMRKTILKLVNLLNESEDNGTD